MSFSRLSADCSYVYQGLYSVQSIYYLPCIVNMFCNVLYCTAYSIQIILIFFVESLQCYTYIPTEQKTHFQQNIFNGWWHGCNIAPGPDSWRNEEMRPSIPPSPHYTQQLNSYLSSTSTHCSFRSSADTFFCLPDPHCFLFSKSNGYSF